jgi:hypothetical protein
LFFTSLVLLPFLLGSLTVPHGKVFIGTLKTLGDENEYLSAIREGGQGYWLWHNPFMVHPPSPMVMYLPYLAFGHLGAVLGLSIHATYALMHGATLIALFVALWVLGSLYLAPGERGWFVAFALATSGLYWLDALLDMAGHAPTSLVWMSMPPLSGLTSALMGAHETLSTAGQVMVLTAVLAYERIHRKRRWWAILYGCLGTLLIGLTLPMLLPVSMAVAGLIALVWVRRSDTGAKRLQVLRQATPGIFLILLPGLVTAAYYFWQLRYGPWSASLLSATGQRPIAESLLQWGVTLPLGLWGWWRAPAAIRPLADALALWCCCALIGLILPFWQGFRFSTGITTMVGATFALGVLRTARSRPVRLRILLLASLGALVHLTFLVSVLLAGGARSLYASEQRDQAIQWIAQHTSERDVLLAAPGFSNGLVGMASCRVVAGHGFMTFDLPLRERQLSLFYGASTGVSERLAVLRATTADYVVYDAQDAENGPFDPRGLPGLRPLYANSEVAVYGVEGAR